jgi:DNA-binding protein YbaB
VSAEFEQLVAQFEQFQSKLTRIDDRFAQVGEMQQELEELEVTATSPDRTITVVAGPGGAIRNIQLTDKAMGQSAQALASALLSTVQQAVAESARKQAAIVDEHVGGQMGLTDQVLQTQAQLFGTSPEELRSQLEHERRPRHGAKDEDDYSERTIMRSDSGSGGRSGERPPPPSGDQFLRNLFDQEDR